MSNESSAGDNPFSTQLRAELAAIDVTDAVALLSASNLYNKEVAAALAQSALLEAETETGSAWKWVTLARQINAALGEQADINAQIQYAEARLHTAAGEFGQAEASLRQAQLGWQQLGDETSLTRSHLGLSQILTIQGRYEEAESSLQQAVHALENSVQNGEPDQIVQLLHARRNLANLLIYQEKHEESLEALQPGEAEIEQWRGQPEIADTIGETLESELAHYNIAFAISSAHLGRVKEAEVALRHAIGIFESQTDQINCSRARSNLGELYLRTGLYSKALIEFDTAAPVLLNGIATASPQVDYQAGEMLVDRASTFLALNLLPEAESDLLQGIELFRGTKEAAPPEKSEDDIEVAAPYELASALTALGQLYFRLSEGDKATDALTEANRYFSQLDNRYWQNRVLLIQAQAASQDKEWEHVAALLNKIDDRKILSDDQVVQKADQIHAAISDIPMSAAKRLLQIQVHVQKEELDAAKQLIQEILTLIQPSVNNDTVNNDTVNNDGGNSDTGESAAITSFSWPQIQVRLRHAQGQVSHSEKDYKEARRQFLLAIELLEQQRAVLPIEEIRAAYLTDKIELYADLIISILEDSEDSEATSANVNEVFDIVERMRSRTLLERLLATIDQTDTDQLEAASGQLDARNTLRQELHWLYNQLLGESGSRRSTVPLDGEIEKREKALNALEWQASPTLAQAEPIHLSKLQATISPDQQILLYHIVHEEVMVFIVSNDTAKLVRRLCTTTEVEMACRKLRFQLGRVEVGRVQDRKPYATRHAERLYSGVRTALSELHRLLIAPLAEFLVLSRLQFIPTGQLSLVPFHALWGNDRYLLEDFECTYAPSASIAAICKERASSMEASSMEPYQTFAGIGLNDETIPYAKDEIDLCSSYFEQSWSYIDERANRKLLNSAAVQADVLHIATHGLYRFDNPFFSSLKLSDGWIDVREIYRLPLKARLVVLSACESGVGHIQNGDENIGLARGFLGAGAHTLLVSMWNVHDASAHKLMEKTYSNLCQPGLVRPSEALRAAQIAMLKTNQHPYFWAPFIVIG